MSQEEALERIATALEAIAAYLAANVAISDRPRTPGLLSVPGEAPATKKPRSRPTKLTEPQETAAGRVVVAVKPATLEDLRGALQKYAAKVDATAPGTGMAKARELLGAHGNGATRLVVAKDVPGGDQGVIDPKDYQAVINAARA